MNQKENDMTKILYVIGVSLVLLMGCDPGYPHWELSRFRMDPSALGHYEKVNLLYVSKRPWMKSRHNFYYHLVVVSQSSQQTINILTPTQHSTNPIDRETTYLFLPEDHSLTRLELQKTPNPTHVIRNPAFDAIADNDFPTVVGLVRFLTVVDTDKVGLGYIKEKDPCIYDMVGENPDELPCTYL